MGKSNGSSVEGDTKKTDKKESKVKIPPFGTSTSALIYSDFAHITVPSTVSFALNIAATKQNIDHSADGKKNKKGSSSPDGKDGGDDIFVIDDESEGGGGGAGGKKKKKGGKSAAMSKNDPLLQSADTPCERKDCKDVLRLLAESQTRNRRELEDIEDKTDQLIIELKELERRQAENEARQAALDAQENQLQMVLDQLNEQCAKLEHAKHELQLEREGFANRMMVAESERGNWARELHDAQKALKKRMWKKRSEVDEEDDESVASVASHLVIKKSDPATLSKVHEVEKTSYNHMAHHSTMDFGEIPLNIPQIPFFIQAKMVLEGEDLASCASSFASFSRAGKKIPTRSQSRLGSRCGEGASTFLKDMQKSRSPTAATTATTTSHGGSRKGGGSAFQGSLTAPFSPFSSIYSTSSSITMPSALSSSPPLPHSGATSPIPTKQLAPLHVSPSEATIHRQYTYKSVPSPAMKKRMEEENMSRLQCVKKMTPVLDNLPANAFKGYTPSGLTMMRQLNNQTIADNTSVSSDFGNLFSNNKGNGSLSPVRQPWEALDLVFYQERARTAFGRESRVGKMRVRTDGAPLDRTPNKHLTTAPLVSSSATSIHQGGTQGQALLYLSPKK